MTSAYQTSRFKKLHCVDYNGGRLGQRFQVTRALRK